MRRRCKYNLIKHFCCAVTCYWCRAFLDSHGCCSCIGCVVFVKSVQCMMIIRGGYATTWHSCQLSFKELFESTGDSVEDILVRHNKVIFATVDCWAWKRKNNIDIEITKIVALISSKSLKQCSRSTCKQHHHIICLHNRSSDAAAGGD